MDWAHAPIHLNGAAGSYFITAGTYRKQHVLAEAARRDAFIALLSATTREYNIILYAWVVLSNHYHLMIHAKELSVVRPFIQKVHSLSARELNSRDSTPGRRVWFQYWDKYVSHEASYMARLNYIHQNPVHHGIVSSAHNYRWSSLSWFEDVADRSFVRAVGNMKIDKLQIADEF